MNVKTKCPSCFKLLSMISTIFFKDKLKSLSITGMLASFAFLVIIVVTIWGNFKNHELEKYLGTSVILTITFSQSSLLLLARNTNKLVRNVLIAEGLWCG